MSTLIALIVLICGAFLIWNSYRAIGTGRDSVGVRNIVFWLEHSHHPNLFWSWIICQIVCALVGISAATVILLGFVKI